MISWLEDLDKLFDRTDNKPRICWFIHNGKLYEMSVSDYKIIYDILRKSEEVEG